MGLGFSYFYAKLNSTSLVIEPLLIQDIVSMNLII